MPRTIRIGVVGLGMGGAHVMAALAVPGVELAAIGEPSLARRSALVDRVANKMGAKAAKSLSDVDYYDDFKVMARDAGLDGIVLALPTGMHASATRACLKAGVAVLCEKPPTVTTREMISLRRQIRDSGLTYMFCRQQRFDPAKWAARKLVTSGKLGRVYHAEAAWLRTRGIPFREGWGVNKDAGGGVLLDLGIHKVDDAWFTLGCPQPVEVFAATHCAYDWLAKGRKLSMPYNADDNTFGMIKFDDGSSLNVGMTFAMPSAGADDKAIESGAGKRDWQELKIYGTKAGVDVNRRRLITAGKEDVSVKELAIPARMQKMRTGLEGQMADFANAIRTGEDPLNTAEQAVQLMQLLDAMKRSGDSGRSVSIKPLSA